MPLSARNGKVKGLLLPLSFVGFEVFTAVTMKNTIFWDDTPYGSCKNRNIKEM
jgi:hypothetical protein